MISHIIVKTSNIEGTGATFYDMLDDQGNLIFERVFGPSFSGVGLKYDIERNIAEVTVSSERLIGTAGQWQYDSSTFLSWPTYGGDGYTKYTGSFTNQDDGHATTPIVSPGIFQMNNQTASVNIFVSTNGFITINNGSGSIIYTPQSLSSPAAICGNPGDQWLAPGLVMTDGDQQNVYYKTLSVSAEKYAMMFIVYQGTYGSPTSPQSYLLNIYRDSTYQWVETRVKSTVRGNAGPFNSTDVSQVASTISKVWRGDLTGRNWIYMGTGSITV